jgi:hypothetical protein
MKNKSFGFAGLIIIALSASLVTNAQTRSTDQQQVHSHSDTADLSLDSNYKVMRGMIDDLVKDGIVPNHKSLQEVTLFSTEMTVNGKKQPADVFARYKKKYIAWAMSDFSYGSCCGRQSIQGFHLSPIEGL